MTIKITKETVVKFLICLACVLSICMIFCFFGTALKCRYDNWGSLYIDGSLFDWIFGTNDTVKSPGLIILFVVQIISMVVALTYIVCVALKLTNKKLTNILAFVFVVLLLICIILAFLSKIFIKDPLISYYLNEFPGSTREEIETYLSGLYPKSTISVGPISYIVLGGISVVSLISATVLNNVNQD